MTIVRPLSGRGTSIKYHKKNGGIIVDKWGKYGTFQLTKSDIQAIRNFLGKDQWIPLGSNEDDPMDDGLGDFVRKNFHGKLTPRHASAIAPILVKEKWATHKKNQRRPIYLRG